MKLLFKKKKGTQTKTVEFAKKLMGGVLWCANAGIKGISILGELLVFGMLSSICCSHCDAVLT